MRTRNQREIDAEFDRIERNRRRCPVARELVDWIHEAVNQAPTPAGRDRLRELAWSIDYEAGEGRDIALSQAHEIGALVLSIVKPARGRRLPKLTRQINEALARRDSKLPEDPFKGFREED